MITYTILFLCVCMYLPFVTSSTVLRLNTKTKSSITNDDTYRYFTLHLPDNIPQPNSNLIIQVSPDTSTTPYEFQDPDLFISKITETPTHETSTYSTSQYGADILSIPSNDISPNDTIHIGVFCHIKCSFILEAYLSSTIEIISEKQYTFTIQQRGSMLFEFQTRETSYDELQFVFNTPNIHQYKVYISEQTTPSSENSIEVNPAFIGGYSAIITNDSNDYCEGCLYYVLIVNEDDKEEVNVGFIVHYSDDVIDINNKNDVYDIVDVGKVHYYVIKECNVEDDVVVVVTLFSGSGFIKVNGFSKGDDDDNSVDNISIGKNVFMVTNEEVIIITKEDMKQYQLSSSTHNDLYIYYFAFESSSLLIKTHYSSQIHSYHKLTSLSPGHTIKSHLPSNTLSPYHILDYSTTSNITVTITSLIGNVTLYGIFSTDIHTSHYTTNILSNETLLKSHPIFSGYSLSIPHINNTCHHQHHSPQFKLRLNCGFIAIAHCNSNDTHCIYRIRADIDDSYQHIIPKTTYYNIIPKDKHDYYLMTIDNDNDIQTITIVLNSISGDTELSIYKYNIYTNTKEYEIDSSYNNAFIPDVITLYKNTTYTPTLNGSYLIEVLASTFSTYSIYYYTSTTKRSLTVSLELEKGKIIYDILPYNEQYKVYSYNPNIHNNNTNHSDIRITLTRKNIPFEIYVFTALNNFIYDHNDKHNAIKGYSWKSEDNKQLIINKNDLHYLTNTPYYIMVARLDKDDTTPNRTDSFYIGITDEVTEYILSESIYHSVILNDKYVSQKYWYVHADTASDFTLSVNVYYGKVNVYININNVITEDNVYHSYYLNENTKSVFVTIDDTTLQRQCEHKVNCLISILISKPLNESDSFYLISGKSRTNKIQYLLTDVITNSIISPHEKQYYLIEEYSPSPNPRITITFNNGIGEMLLLLTNKTHIKINDFPSSRHFHFKGEDSFYQTRIITIPQSSLTHCGIPCKFLITIYGTKLTYMETHITYNIHYSNALSLLNANTPYRQHISSHELQFFTFNIKPNTHCIHISLHTNNDNYGVNMYLNRGNTLPSNKEYHWRNKYYEYSYIHLDKYDNVLVSQGVNDLSGKYVLMLYSYVNTTYTLVIADHKENIIPLRINVPASCKCAHKGDSCYFSVELLETMVNDVSVVYTAHFAYGSAEMYAKLFNDSDVLYSNVFDNILPNEYNYDYSNADNYQRNFLMININKAHTLLTDKSILILNTKCNEESLFEINTAQLTSSTFDYLEETRENIFYLTKVADTSNEKEKTVLSHYIYQNKTINYEIYSYTGFASITVYQNKTIYNNVTNSFDSMYNELCVCNVSSKQSLFNSVDVSMLSEDSNLYFKVTPLTNIGFYIKLNYAEDWIKVPIGVNTHYQINNGYLYGYFDMPIQYSNDVVLTIMPFNTNTNNNDDDDYANSIYNYRHLQVYVKLNIFEKDIVPLPSLFDYPSDTNYDYIGTNNALVHNVNLLIKQVPLSIRQNRFVKVLFSVITYSDIKTVKILITPSIANIKRVNALPKESYYSNGNSIIDISKTSKDDDMIVIDISMCGKGSVSVDINDNYYGKEFSTSESIFTEIEKPKRKVMLLSNATARNYYLTINESAIETNEDILTERNGNNEDVDYLIYYYTFNTSIRRYNSYNDEGSLMYKVISVNEIEITLPRGVDVDSKEWMINVFVSRNVVDYVHMESLCYLSKHIRSFENVSDVTYVYETRTVKVKGLMNWERYYVNVKVRNVNSGEMIVFKPLQVDMKYMSKGSKLGMVFCCLGGCAVVFYGVVWACGKCGRKGKKKEMLNGEVNDVRAFDVEAPRSMSEMKDMMKRGDDDKKNKYATLSDNI